MEKRDLRRQGCRIYGIALILLMLTGSGCGRTEDFTSVPSIRFEGQGEKIKGILTQVFEEAGEISADKAKDVLSGDVITDISGESSQTRTEQEASGSGDVVSGQGAQNSEGAFGLGQNAAAPDGGIDDSGQGNSTAGDGTQSGQGTSASENNAAQSGGGAQSGQGGAAAGNGTQSGQEGAAAGNGTSSNQGSSAPNGGAAVKPGAAGTVTGVLSVEGTQLVDASGNPVQLRGISTHGLAWYPDYVNGECFRELKEEWGANVVRLAMYTAEYEGYCTGGDKDGLKELVKKGVGYAVESGLYVIIDWHILSDGNPNTYLEDAKEFFAEMSKEYADYTNVLYEICNEPNGGTGWSDIKQYAEQVIEVIRENDNDGIILVGTPNWSQYVDQAAADPIEGYDNIMYTLHFYAATHTDGLRNTMISAVESGLPVFVSEYGICDASGNGAIDEYQANQWMDVLNQYQISYVAWNLSNKSETSAVFKSSCEKKSGFDKDDLSDSGKWLYHMLQSKGAEGEIPDSGSMADGTENNGQGSHGGNTSGTSGGGQSNNAGGAAGGGQSSNAGNGASGGGQNNNAGSGASGGGQNNDVGSGNSAADDTQDNSSENNGGVSGNTQNNAAYEAADLSVDSAIINSWTQGDETYYQYSLTISNSAETEQNGWNIGIVFSDAISLSGGWNGNYQAEGNTLAISCMDYNGCIGAGASVNDIGFIISGSKELKILEVF